MSCESKKKDLVGQTILVCLVQYTVWFGLVADGGGKTTREKIGMEGSPLLLIVSS